jgi:hypothetical protein
MTRAFVNRFAWPRIAGGILVLGAGLAFPAVLLGEPDSTAAANGAKNLARLNCGTRVSLISAAEAKNKPLDSADSDPAGLLLDDNTVSYQLARGNNAFVVALPNICSLDRFTFINENPDLNGTVRIYVSNYRLSPNDSRWMPVGRNVDFGKQRFVGIPLAAVEGKYVKLLFRVEKPGTIAGLGLYGQRTLTAFADQPHAARIAAAQIAYTSPEPLSKNNLNFNFANLYARASIVSVSSGPGGLVNRMIDDDPTTAFDFADDDPQPTVVVELASDQRLRRVSALYEMRRGRLDIYLLDRLPQPSSLENIKPMVSVTDDAGSGKAAAEFDPHGARYIALRWTSIGPFKETHSFKIAEIGAFSDAAPSIFDLQGIPEFAKSSTLVNVPTEPPVVVPVSP